MAGDFSDCAKNYKWNIFHFLILLFFTITNLFGQQANNLQVIWTKTTPPSILYFGMSLSSGDLNGDGYSDIVVTAESLYSNTGTIKAYIFYGSPQFDTMPDLIISRPESTGFICSICVKDINNDGYDDLVLGSQHISEISIFFGGNPMDTICDYRIRGPHASALGCAISSGDVNGDGFGDLIVGAYMTTVAPAGFVAGRVYIYYGGPNFDTTPDVILNGGHCNDQEGFGRDIAQCVDVNSDGYDDVIICAVNFGACNGRLYVYYGGNPMDTTADVTMIGEGPEHSLGWNAITGLRNANNFDYAVVGTPVWPFGYPAIGPGKVYVLYGGNPMDSIPDISIIGRRETSGLAQSLSRAGYISGVLSDAIVSGAPWEDNSFGCAYIWNGEPNLDTVPDAWLSGVYYDQEIGSSVASAGDVNGDGIDEIIISNFASWTAVNKVWICKYTETGIEEEHFPPVINHLPIEVYPNPVSSVIRIRIPLSVDHTQIKIFDISGKIVKETGDCFANARNDNTTQIQVSLRGIPIGIYFVEVTAEDKGKRIRETKKIEIVK